MKTPAIHCGEYNMSIIITISLHPEVICGYILVCSWWLRGGICKYWSAVVKRCPCICQNGIFWCSPSYSQLPASSWEDLPWEDDHSRPNMDDHTPAEPPINVREEAMSLTLVRQADRRASWNDHSIKNTVTERTSVCKIHAIIPMENGPLH